MRHLLLLGLVAGLSVLALALAEMDPQVHESYTFSQYLVDFDKRYASPSEFRKREALFLRRRNDAIVHNANPAHTWRMGINHMSDWTESELSMLTQHKMPRPAEELLKKPYVRMHTPLATSEPLPASVDYRRRFPAVITGIKDQGRCGSCYATTASALAESYWALKTGELWVLSTQQLTACPPNPGQCGGKGYCRGNIVTQVYDWVINENGGNFSQEWAYPYASYLGELPECRMDVRKTKVNVKGYTLVPPNDEAALLEAVAHAGPQSVTFAAETAFHSYKSGIYPACNYTNNITLNHGVELVGYGHDAETGLDYWILRNSWNAGWGMGGYAYLERLKTPQCGWNVNAQAGESCASDPTVQRVCGSCGLALAPVYPNM